VGVPSLLMCLYSTKNDNNRFKANHANKDIVLVWKVYDLSFDSYGRKKNSLLSPFQCSWVHGPGVVQSNRLKKKVSNGSGDYYYASSHDWAVYNGIHVYTSRDHALSHCQDGQVVVCCHAKMSNFVAAETNCAGELSEAVFMEITISPRNYRRATRRK